MDSIHNLASNNSSEDSLVFWTALLTIATFLLFIAAVFQEKIKNHFYKPKLNCLINLESPDCHLIRKNQTYFFRFRIENNGNVSAKNVEVIIKNVKDSNHNQLELSQDNLLWSSYLKEAFEPDKAWSLKERMYWDYISPGTYQYCNLGYIRKPTLQNPILKVALSIYWPSQDGKSNLENGKYSFEIIVGCENGKTLKKKFELEFSFLPAEWDEDEKEFFKKIAIREKG